jgi:phytoene dehydrogenase-like protein
MVDAEATTASFAAIGEADDAVGFDRLYEDTRLMAEKMWPTVTEPLLTRSEVRSMVDDGVWDRFIEKPLGGAIEHYLSGDVSRGVALTDALIGTFSYADDPSLAQNRCFLYHVIGGTTGVWDVPRGGMGAVSGEMSRAAREAGAELVTSAEVVRINPGSTSERASVTVVIEW